MTGIENSNTAISKPSKAENKLSTNKEQKTRALNDDWSGDQPSAVRPSLVGRITGRSWLRYGSARPSFVSTIHQICSNRVILRNRCPQRGCPLQSGCYGRGCGCNGRSSGSRLQLYRISCDERVIVIKHCLC